MKILWIVNIIFPYPSEQLGINKTVFGGWLNGLASTLLNIDGIQLAIATVYNGKTIKEFNDGKIIYYLLPNKNNIKYNKRLENEWKIITNKFKPDIVHIHGTEYPHALAYLNACPKVKSITSIQGILYKCAEVYNANIPYKEIKKNITFRDLIKRDGIIQSQKNFFYRSIFEKEIIEKSNIIIGRTTWDYSNIKAIKPNVKYKKGNETLRNQFYCNEWDITNIEKHSIFVSQASYPIKGLHYLLECINILRNQYSDIKLYIGGQDIVTTKTFKDKVKLSGYGKYIKRIIQRYGIERNIIFTGMLNEKQIKERLLKSNVFVLPSAIENSSNSLGEAMLLGMPCVASNTGGTMDMLKHEQEGFLYSYTEPAMCAEYISRYFENEDLAVQHGKKARETALKRHNEKENLKKIINIYKEVMESDE